MTILHPLARLLLLTICLGLAVGPANSQNRMQAPYPTPRADSTPSRIVTLTRVKTPWYGFRFLLLRGFKKSIPEYQHLNGLLRKAYAISDGGSAFGGIYLWKSSADAQNWFNEAWFERVQKTYGMAGKVEEYRVIQTTDVAPLPASEGDYRAVLSLSASTLAVDLTAPGLLRLLEVAGANGQTGFITFWQTKAGANAFVKHHPATHTEFDTPVFLDNAP